MIYLHTNLLIMFFFYTICILLNKIVNILDIETKPGTKNAQFFQFYYKQIKAKNVQLDLRQFDSKGTLYNVIYCLYTCPAFSRTQLPLTILGKSKEPQNAHKMKV